MHHVREENFSAIDGQSIETSYQSGVDPLTGESTSRRTVKSVYVGAIEGWLEYASERSKTCGGGAILHAAWDLYMKGGVGRTFNTEELGGQRVCFGPEETAEPEKEGQK